MKILLCVLINCLFMLSSTFGSSVYITSKGASINKSALLSCMDKNTCNFGAIKLSSNCVPFNISSKYNTSLNTSEYIEIIQSNLQSNDLPAWYYILCHCRTNVIVWKNYWPLFDEISYKSLPDKCKELLNGNIKELKKKCDIPIAEKLSLLTAINPSYEEALSSMREINKDGSLSYNYTLTEAIFILHLNPSQSCTNYIMSFFRKNNYEDKNVLFYARCLIGALACVLKHDGKIPADFEFDLLQTGNEKSYFLTSVKRLMQTYMKYLINKQNAVNNRPHRIETNKKQVYSNSQVGNNGKLKQD